METVYRLRDRKDSLLRMQEASLSHPFLGVKVTHGLIGTDEWWENIATGKLQRHSVRGFVTGLWLGMHNSEPGTFAIQAQDGTVFREMTTLEASESIEKFPLGRAVEVDYVIQEPKYTLEGSREDHRVVLEIRLDDEVNPECKPIGPCYFTWLQDRAASIPASAADAASNPGRSVRWWKRWR